MTRLIDADEFINEMTYMCHRFGIGEHDRRLSLDDIKINVVMMHTVDAVPVIRCKDCKFSVDEYQDGDCYCRRTNRPLEWIGDWDFFCADGAKMDEVEHGHN